MAFDQYGNGRTAARSAWSAAASTHDRGSPYSGRALSAGAPCFVRRLLRNATVASRDTADALFRELVRRATGKGSATSRTSAYRRGYPAATLGESLRPYQLTAHTAPS